MICLDTSFLIDVILGRPIPEAYENLLDENDKFSITSPSIMELIKGLNLSKNLKYVTQEEKDKINKIISSMNIFDFNMKSAILAGEIEAELRNKGELIDIMDIMIGAIAKHNNQILITKNPKHFEKIKGLKIEDY
ncbi:PIN domain nuclease [Candidatus Pacearchaeota archaeon CG10_big_fil_rev_8_21_14_0_10_34_12]|nr:MAG: PIN domain nuclease [Candidatus Pacearchaeota archaeon CG10_big_fil_rev_8_21_14_0_10_34_12]